MQLTKQLLSWLPLFLLIGLATGCERENYDIASNTDFPPAILNSTPSANARVVAGDFDLRVTFVDGTVSPLASATVTLSDSAMNVLATATEELSGVQDSLVIAGSSFGAADLGVGTYNMAISVTDSKGQTTEQSFTFEISDLPYPANHGAIYLAGAFNGWGADELTLVGDNMWEIRDVDLGGEGWKLKNTVDWSDEDWGDTDCNGFMESSKNGNGNTECGFSGPAVIRFNDQTLAYSVTPLVSYASNTPSLYLLGTFNNFQGSDYQFSLVDDNTWMLEEVELMPGAQFKMAEMPDFQGVNYGDDENDGVAEQYGSNIVLPEDAAEGLYSVTFNDRTLAYEVTFLRGSAPESVGIIGAATPGGWDEDTDMTAEGDGVYSIVIELTEGPVKFRANNAWDLNWGGSDFPSGTAVVGGDDIMVTAAGSYRVTLDITNLTYSFTEDAGVTAIGLIGSAVPGGWEPADGDFNLVYHEGTGMWMTVVTLVEGELKFRANDAWDLSWGAEAFPSGTATSDNGPNIPVSADNAGTYLVTFDPVSGDYTFTPATISLIGAATPGGWESDTDLQENPEVVGEWMLPAVTLGADEFKFRVNGEWTYNWGGEAAAFPTGTAEYNAGNITATAGEYAVKFNVNTLQYSFE